MKLVPPLLLIAILFGCAADETSVKLHDDYMEIDGVPVDSMSSIYEQLQEMPRNRRIKLLAHPCLNSDRFVEVLNYTKELGFKNTLVSRFGSSSDADCH